MVEDQSQCDVEFDIDDAQDVGLEGSAEAGGGFQVGDTLDERAAVRAAWWGPNNNVHQTIEQVGASPQFEGVPRARLLRVWGGVHGRRVAALGRVLLCRR